MKRLAPLTCFSFFALLLLSATMSFAQEPASATDELISLVGKAVVEEVTQADEDLKKAKEVLDIVLGTGTPTEQEQAQKEVEAAEERYQKAEKNLDTARVDGLANACGKTSAEIQAMRNSGMGWGKIAKECGVHPSYNGKGNSKNKNESKNKSKNKSKSKGKDKD